MENFKDLVDRLGYALEDKSLLNDKIDHGDWVEILSKSYCIHIYNQVTGRKKCDIELPCIHIDFDLLQSSFDKIIQRIFVLEGLSYRIYARQTVVARIDKKVTMAFLQEHHLNIAMPGKYRYGLYYKGELVSIAVFSGGRRMKEISPEYRSFELIRFCHKSGVHITGGISKLLKAFIKDFNPNDIMTYADRDWSNDSSLEVIGFKVIGYTESQRFYVINNERKSHIEPDEKYDFIIENSGSIKLKLFVS